MLSRVSGYGRDLSMAAAFGICPSVAALFIALRFSNLLRRLVAEGPFQSIFVPYFEEIRVKGETSAHNFFKSLVGIFLFSLIGICIFVEVIIAVALFYGSFSPDIVEILHLVKWLFPAIIFICLYGLNQAFLSCYDIFFLPSLAPIACNVCWIAGVVVSYNSSVDIAMLTVAKFIFFGYFVQWLLTTFQTFGRLGIGITVSFSKEIKKLFKAFVYGAIGVGAMQLNVLADTIFARIASPLGPGYLWYSIRMQQLVLGLLGIALVTTVVPRFSRAIKNLNNSLAQELFSSSVHKIFIVMMPCTFMIFVTAPSAINLLYGRGAFTSQAILQTAYCLYAYGLALTPAVMVMLLTAYFFALHKVKIPTTFSLVSVALNILLNSLFVFVLDYGAASIALSTAISAWVNYLLLYNQAKKEKLTILVPSIKRLFSVCLFASLTFTFFEPLLFNQPLLSIINGDAIFQTSLTGQLYQFSMRCGLFIGLMSFFGYIFRCRDLLQIIELFVPKKASELEATYL